MTDTPSEPESAAREKPAGSPLEPPQLLPKRIPTSWVIASLLMFFGTLFYFGGIRLVLVVLGVIVGLTAIVMMHEGAHLIVGQKCGMKITEYFVGFGPRIWSRRRGEIEYGVKSIPAGGYVKIIGMTELEKVAPEDASRTYIAQSYSKRVATTSAGIVSHFILAFLLTMLLLAMYGIPREASMTIDSAARGTGTKIPPAQLAGFQKGDRIVSYERIKATTWVHFQRFVNKQKDKETKVVVSRDGQLKTLVVTPVDRSLFVDTPDQIPGQPAPKVDHGGYIGLGPSVRIERIAPWMLPVQAGNVIAHRSVDYIKAIGALFSPSGVQEMYQQLTDDPEANNNYRLASPTGLTRATGQAAREGFQTVLGLIIAINLAVGLMNLIPLLPLDGGHIAIATYERLRSRNGKRYRADIQKQVPIAYALVAFLTIMYFSSWYLDILRPAADPFK